MPELPEVETVVNDLRPRLRNLRIIDLVIFGSKQIKQPIKEFRHLILKQKIVGLSRRAKIILFNLGNNYTLIIHLKMSGQLIFVSPRGKKQTGGHPIPRGLEDLPNKYTQVIFRFNNGGHLFFNDLRKFGYLLVWPTVKLADFFINKKLGMEPLAQSFRFDRFYQGLKKRPNSTIKAALLAQSIVAGLGNIYVDEVLFQVKLRPTRRIKTLSRIDIKRLYQFIPRALRQAIKMRGTTFRFFRDGQGQAGGMLDYLKVYGRTDQLCLVCHKAMIKRIRQGNRSSHYCPACQC